MNRRAFALTLIYAIPAASLAALAQAKKEQAKCPVCGLMVDKDGAPTFSYKGQTYYFESNHDRDLFKSNPEKYVVKK